MHDRLQDGKVDGYINTPDVLSTLHKNLVNFAFGNHLRRQISKIKKTRMWANAQRDGRPAEHRWRPLFNAAKFGGRPLLDAVQ